VLRFEEDEPVSALGCYYDGHAEFAIATASKKQTTLSVYSENSDTVCTYCLPPNYTIIDIAFIGTCVLALTNASTLLIRRDPKTHVASGQLKSIQLPGDF